MQRREASVLGGEAAELGELRARARARSAVGSGGRPASTRDDPQRPVPTRSHAIT